MSLASVLTQALVTRPLRRTDMIFGTNMHTVGQGPRERGCSNGMEIFIYFFPRSPFERAFLYSKFHDSLLRSDDKKFWSLGNKYMMYDAFRVIFTLHFWDIPKDGRKHHVANGIIAIQKNMGWVQVVTLAGSQHWLNIGFTIHSKYFQ